MVGLGGLEPPASRLSGVRSNQLSYRPSFKTAVLVLSRVAVQKAVLDVLKYACGSFFLAPCLKPKHLVLNAKQPIPIVFVNYYIYKDQNDP